MSTLKNEKTADQWKNKYYDLLDQNEGLEKAGEEKEELLCKTIVKLSLAAMGQHRQLDHHLDKIRDQLKKGLRTDLLKNELDYFSKTLVDIENADLLKIQLHADSLFDFLKYCFPEKQGELTGIVQKLENQEISNENRLFQEIYSVIIAEHPDPSHSIQNETNDYSSTIDASTILQHLRQLLDDSEVPLELEGQAIHLKDKLHSELPISQALDETVQFLFEVKKHIQSEHLEITTFLTQLTDQLAEIGNVATDVHSASIESAKKRNLLDQAVSSQVLDLQQSSKSATQLEPLKQLIHSRLEAISQQLKEHQDQEQKERNKAEKTETKLAAMTVKLKLMESESKLLQERLAAANERATHDPLTGLPNRLAYENRLSIELARWKRYKAPISLIIWDIDHFKKINDSFGHKAGDKTLILISKLLAGHSRETDFVSRFGGEEFVMLLPDTDGESAVIAANKIRSVIEKSAFNSSGKKISITISCGITQFNEADTPEAAFKRADKALYQAKNKGRNQCVLV